MSGLNENEIAELGCTYAALILHDDKIGITADKISTILKAANIKYQPFYPTLFAKVLAAKNLDDLILSAGSGSGPAPVQHAAEEKKEEKKEEKGGDKGGKGKKEEKKKEEPKEEEEQDLGLSLFD